MHFRKLKKKKELNALMLQKHVRGWLTRKRFQLLRDKHFKEKIEKERLEKQNDAVLMKPFVSRSALLKKLNAESSKGDKENHAAVVIQTCKYLE